MRLSRTRSAHAEQGADVIEVGGRIDAARCHAGIDGTEIERAIPVSGRNPTQTGAGEVAITIDTVKSEVARDAARSRRDDRERVSGMRIDPRWLDSSRCGVQGGAHAFARVGYGHGIVRGAQYSNDRPMTSSDERATSRDRTRDIATGIERDRIMLDPGIGFLKSERAFARGPCGSSAIGRAWLRGDGRRPSKRFIGEVTGMKKPEDRDAGTIGADVVAFTLGATWFRVHDVLGHRHALDVAAAILERRA